jgi:hypothetical protein
MEFNIKNSDFLYKKDLYSSKMKKILIIFISLIFSINTAQAACDFIINIGDTSKKIEEKIASPIPMFPGQFMLPVQSPEVCPSDNLNENIAVEYIFLGANPEVSLRLAAIRMVVLNDGQNTESDKLTLMKYAKKVYGDFDTGQNPKVFNNFMIWEKNNSIIIYKRMFNEEDLIEEEIYISNKEYDQKLGEFYNQIELKELEQDEQTN